MTGDKATEDCNGLSDMSRLSAVQRGSRAGLFKII